ncbi:MAG: hypothetical protein CML55_10210 [Rhodobacteraceae bacterium]|nr:hypothetical protein [Paracoccaceae bacterium]|tara:strand:+ start:210 stop:557 length:348 start_codon:yes stop_codon:yes gene_type:complete
MNKLVSLDKRPEPSISLEQKLIAYQALSRYRRSDLTPSEISLLFYIIDRSIGYGKAHFRASTKNIIENKEPYCHLGLSKSTFFRTLKSLEEKEAIIRKGDRYAITLKPNLRWLLA